MKKNLQPVLIPLFAIVLLAVFFGLEFFIRSHLLVPSFIRLERQMASKDVIRCIAAIRREQFHLGTLAADWSEWDDTYAFMIDRNDSFRQSNLQMETLTEVGINLLFMISPEGQIVLDQIFDPKQGKIVTLPGLSAHSFTPDHPFSKKSLEHNGRFDGIVLTSLGPMFVAANLILTSEGNGPPRGTLVMGRFLDQTVIDDLNHQTQIRFSIKNRNDPDLNSLERKAFSGSPPNITINEIPKNDQQLIALATLSDIDNKPALLVEAHLPRDIYQQGLKTARLISMVFLSSAFLISFSIILSFYLYRRRVRSHHERIETLVARRTAELSASDARLNALNRASSEAIFLIEGEKCLAVNKKAGEIFNYPERELSGIRITDLIEPGQRKKIDEMMSSKNDHCCELTGLRKDGSTFPLLLNCRTVDLNGKSIRAFAFQDLTEEKYQEKIRLELEKQLERSKKMESLGLMAGGVAHDLNNILSGIVTYPEVILMNLPGDSKIRKPLEAIRKAGKRAAEVVADLLTVARGVVMEMEPLDLNSIVHDYLDSPEFATLKGNHPEVTVKLRLNPDLPPVLGSKTHISKCLVNLVTNGAEAILETGIITVSSYTEHFEAGRAKACGLTEGTYSVLAVDDTGQGINPADLEHIFEPFYSRKVTGRSGTGLGLAVVWNTLQDHKGTVRVNSSGNGSIFRMYFPVTTWESANKDLDDSPKAVMGKGERILVVDDDPQQLEIADQLLTSLNYSVLTVLSGEEAIEIITEHPADLVILDMIMKPGMSGLETFSAILTIYPDQKALIASGYSESGDARKALELGAGSFVRKPYSIRQISKAIREILDA